MHLQLGSKHVDGFRGGVAGALFVFYPVSHIAKKALHCQGHNMPLTPTAGCH